MNYNVRKIAEAFGVIGEIIVDENISSEIGKAIPCFDLFFKAKDAYISVSDALLANKVKSFLSSLDGVTEEKKDSFVKDMNDNTEYRERVDETILHTLDKADSLKKSKWVGDVFNAYLLEAIDHSEMLKMYDSINNCFVLDLENLKKSNFDQHVVINYDGLSRGFFVRFQTSQELELTHGSNSFSLQYEITELGKMWIKIVNGKSENLKKAREHQKNRLLGFEELFE